MFNASTKQTTIKHVRKCLIRGVQTYSCATYSPNNYSQPYILFMVYTRKMTTIELCSSSVFQTNLVVSPALPAWYRTGPFDVHLPLPAFLLTTLHLRDKSSGVQRLQELSRENVLLVVSHFSAEPCTFNVPYLCGLGFRRHEDKALLAETPQHSLVVRI